MFELSGWRKIWRLWLEGGDGSVWMGEDLCLLKLKMFYRFCWSSGFTSGENWIKTNLILHQRQGRNNRVRPTEHEACNNEFVYEFISIFWHWYICHKLVLKLIRVDGGGRDYWNPYQLPKPLLTEALSSVPSLSDNIQTFPGLTMRRSVRGGNIEVAVQPICWLNFPPLRVKVGGARNGGQEV